MLTVALVLAQVLAAPAAPVTPRDQARDFAADIKRFFVVVACGTLDDAPVLREDEALRREHCSAVEPMLERYTTFWNKRVEPTLSRIPPKGARTLVYPFGGGDLVTALGTFPDATDVTTLSLEPMGDPRALFAMPLEQRREVLALARRNLKLLLIVEHSKTSNLRDMTATGVTAQLVFTMAALRLRGFAPVDLRYFQLTSEGAVDYLSAPEIEALDRDLVRPRAEDGAIPTPRARAWKFGNAELGFAKAGEGARTFRHLAGNLANDLMDKDRRMLRYLETKGRVVAMTKAAAYLLWSPRFSQVKDYLVSHVDFMISDSTGLTPEDARAHGFRQLTWGVFEGPFLPAPRKTTEDFVALWNAQPKRPLPFRYGYPDSAGHSHMLVTTKLPEEPGGEASSAANAR